ncbi:MAG: DNA repair ATPase [Thiolinea sp.]
MTKTSEDQTTQTIAESNAYEIIRARLEKQGKSLEELTAGLNNARLNEFQSTAMAVSGRLRVRTENNCVARDIVQVGEQLLFGYNVFIGLKKETRIEDVFTLYTLTSQDGQYELAPVPAEDSFLAHPGFAGDFRELYAYYKHARLIQLVVKNGKLLAAFQIGERITDLRVFRWAISPRGELTYIDNRGERDIALPSPVDFEWVACGRDDTVHGRHPHLNILDTLFVETIGGDLTIKVENNTNSGLGIYSEEVSDKTQSLDDARFFYAEVGQLILLKVLPYREEVWRYLVFNRLTEQVQRIDAIGQSCVRLPEDHGIIFPGGMYLQNGENRQFEHDMSGMTFKRMQRSPNGEDVLYIFYEPLSGNYALFSYNLIEKDLRTPLFGHGYAIRDDGQMVLFSSDSEEPTRIHPMQIWQTPYISDEYASRQPAGDSFYARIGNAELVRGISDLYSISRSIENSSVSTAHYNQLIQDSRRLFEAYYWLENKELDAVKSVLHDIVSTSEKVLDEFEKVESIRAQADKAMQAAETEQKRILSALMPDSWSEAGQFVDALNAIRHHRGHLMTIREYRYIDQERLSEMDAELIAVQDELGSDTVHFLAGERALLPYQEQLGALETELAAAATLLKLEEVLAVQEKMAADLDLLSELMATLKVDDANVRTKVIDDISGIYARLNQLRARTTHRKKEIGRSEAVAQFGVQFKLFSQSVSNALGLATTPDKCDEQLSRLLVQMEELESQFSEHDEFLADIINKREEVHESFEAHKQSLINERQRRAQNLMDATQRIIASVQRRVSRFSEMDELNTFFASDPLVMKIRDITDQLRELGDSVKADDLDSSLKNHKEQAVRSLRDKQDIFEDGGNIIRLGPVHRFSVTKQELGLTLLPRGEHQYIHLSGTDFFERVDSAELDNLRDYWEQNLESETPAFYRAEYLAGQVMVAMESGEIDPAGDLIDIVRRFAAPRYKEGYEKGIHDHDAVKILQQLLPVKEKAGLLRFDPLSRGLAAVFWVYTQTQQPQQDWPDRATAAADMRRVFADSAAMAQLRDEVVQELQVFWQPEPVTGADAAVLSRAAAYLCEELANKTPRFTRSVYAQQLADELRRQLDIAGALDSFNAVLRKLEDKPAQLWKTIEVWLQALLKGKDSAGSVLAHYIPEAVALVSLGDRLPHRLVEAGLEMRVDELLGDHPLIQSVDGKRQLPLSLDKFLSRYQQHHEQVVPGYQHYLQVRGDIIDQQREQLRLNEFKPRPLASFVRNKLLNESYLPLIGDNLAKQMGTVGDNKRTDLMGMLMLISPPGYGKTTLMEYVASRLGLIFMKINCPSLGHSVVSLDPEQAPDRAAAQELVKLNLGLEMTNNVMLYLDDIQHTHPGFLQKFISLADGTRRVDGIRKGKSKTYDMRGKRFCIIMAGNPYTESGEVFKIPDMLANRADIYNLGEVLGDKEDIFALSYLENGLTSNSVLAPLATRDMKDVYTLIDLARGREVSTNDLSHSYSSAELNEITEVFKKLFVVQEVVLKVNKQYIASAAQNDEYRTEPPFKLQGSYRNMNKMAEKVSAAMNDAELLQMIEDHYQGEAQLLTGGAEENLLKLAELRGNMTTAEQERWEAIKQEYRRNRLARKADVEIGLEIAEKLGEISLAFKHSDQLLESNQEKLQTTIKHMVKHLHHISYALVQQSKSSALDAKLGDISAALQTLGNQLQQALLQPGVNDVLLPQLEGISQQLQQLNRGVDSVKDQREVAVQLQDIARGVQLMGQELAEVSDTSTQKLNWLTRINHKNARRQ